MNAVFLLPEGLPVAQGSLPDATGRKNMRLLIQLRWMAVIGQVATIAVVHFGLDVRLQLMQMVGVLLTLVVFNIISSLRCRARPSVSNNELFAALLVDVWMLTAQLYFSGGATNPFISLYLLQVTLGAVLLSGWRVWAIVVFTAAGFIGLDLVSQPLPLPMTLERGLGSPQMQAVLICFVLNAALLVVFITRINRNLRQRDARLASLRQRAAEEEHIVRMGLLASGAAHELGTPLATLAVILGDWARAPPVAGDPELRQDVSEMQAQVQRCKSIVSGILLSAGEARGEGSEETTLLTFLDRLVDEWRLLHPASRLDYDNRFGADAPMASDSTLKQMIFNVLDNAHEAAPEALRLEVDRERDDMVLTVTDQGPGFAPAMLAQIGKPYQSTKGRPGKGLGLFLSVNVARTLGGQLTAGNTDAGGARVRITLPLAVLVLDDEPDHPNGSAHAS
jgi:two-component system sensor histidine kinase RegB